MDFKVGDRIILSSTTTKYDGQLGTIKDLNYKGRELVALEMDINTYSVDSRTHEEIKNGHIWVTDLKSLTPAVMTNRERMKRDLLSEVIR